MVLGKTSACGNLGRISVGDTFERTKAILKKLYEARRSLLEGRQWAKNSKKKHGSRKSGKFVGRKKKEGVRQEVVVRTSVADYIEKTCVGKIFGKMSPQRF